MVFKFLDIDQRENSSKNSAFKKSGGKGADRKLVRRRFHASNTVNQIISFVATQSAIPCSSPHFEVVRAYPTLSLSAAELRDATIEEIGLESNSLLSVRFLPSS